MKLLRQGFAAVLVSAWVVGGYDYWDNATHAHWRLSPKRGVSDQIEAYQGQPNGFDWFSQRCYLIESDYVFDQVEPSRLFEMKAVTATKPLQELVKTTFPTAEMVRAYWQLGEIDNVLNLAEKVLAGNDLRLLEVVVPDLANIQSKQISELIFTTLKATGKDYFTETGLKYKNMQWFQKPSSSYYSFLNKLLKDSDSGVRWSAAKALGQLGDRIAVAPLIELLKDSDFSERWSAASALVQLGDRTVVAPLIELLKDSDFNVRRSAAWALGQLGDRTAVAPLIELLKDSKSSVRSGAASALGQLGDRTAVTPLIELLKDSDYSVRRSAAWALGQLGDRTAVTPLIELLKDSNSSVRSGAAKDLGQLGDRAAVTPLIELLRDSDFNVRSRAAEALGQLGDRIAVAPLIELLKDSDSSVRSGAAKVLGQLGDRIAVAPLIELLKDSDSSERWSAASALSQLEDRTAIALLIQLFKDSDHNMRSNAAEASGQLGDRAAVTPLIELLRDSDDRVRRSAAKALGQLGDQGAIFPITLLLNDSDLSVRAQAEETRIQLGDQTAISTVADLLENSVESLKKPEEIGKYLQSLNSSHIGKKRDAIITLGQAKVAEALPQIRPLLTHSQENLTLRLATLDALGNNATAGMAEDFIQVIQEAPQHFTIKGYHALGNTGSPVAEKFLRQQLTTYDTCKANWRARRDQDQLSDFSTLPKQLPAACENFIESEQVVLKTYLESPLAFAIAKLNPEAGIQLLSHNLANVRKGAALGLGMMGSIELLQQLYQQHQRITSTEITQVFKRQAIYRAIDNMLIKLELRGTEQEWQQLKAFAQTAQITHPGIKERVEWTIDQLDFNLHRKIKKIYKP